MDLWELIAQQLHLNVLQKSQFSVKVVPDWLTCEQTSPILATREGRLVFNEADSRHMVGAQIFECNLLCGI